MKIQMGYLCKTLVYKQLVSGGASAEIQNCLTPEAFFFFFTFYFEMSWTYRKVARVIQRTSVYFSPRLTNCSLLAPRADVFHQGAVGSRRVCKVGADHCADLRAPLFDLAEFTDVKKKTHKHKNCSKASRDLQPMGSPPYKGWPLRLVFEHPAIQDQNKNSDFHAPLLVFTQKKGWIDKISKAGISNLRAVDQNLWWDQQWY